MKSDFTIPLPSDMKWMLTSNARVKFEHRDGDQLIYSVSYWTPSGGCRCVCGSETCFRFPVPIADFKPGEHLDTGSPVLLMKYISRHLEKNVVKGCHG